MKQKIIILFLLLIFNNIWAREQFSCTDKDGNKYCFINETRYELEEAITDESDKCSKEMFKDRIKTVCYFMFKNNLIEHWIDDEFNNGGETTASLILIEEKEDE